MLQRQLAVELQVACGHGVYYDIIATTVFESTKKAKNDIKYIQSGRTLLYSVTLTYQILGSFYWGQNLPPTARMTDVIANVALKLVP